MDLKPKPHHYIQWLGATLAAVLTTVGLAMTSARETTAGMVFLVVVVDSNPGRARNLVV